MDDMQPRSSPSERKPNQNWDLKHRWPRNDCQSAFVVLVPSQLENSKIREKLRKNFISKYKYETLQQYFILGNGGGLSEEQIKRMRYVNSAYAESDKYGDIIFGDFDDHNQVLKTYLSYKFIFEKCQSVKEGSAL